MPSLIFSIQVVQTTPNTAYFCFLYVSFFFLWFFEIGFFLDSHGCPGIFSVDRTGLELRDPPTSASRVLELQVCTTTARHSIYS